MEHTPRNEEERMAWTLLGTWGIFEYWLDPAGEHVSRRKVSSYNYLDADGAPVGARWDSTLVHFKQYVAIDRDDPDRWDAYCRSYFLGSQPTDVEAWFEVDH